MGNNPQSQFVNSQRWRVVEDKPHCQVLRGPSSQEVERYFLAPGDANPMEHFEARRNPPRYWVRVLDCRFNEPTNIQYVVLERVRRLKELKKFSLEEGTHFLKQLLRAYVSLERVFGRFKLSAQMIGLNRSNEVRMWICENFASNRPSRLVLCSQQEIVEDILLLVSSRLRERKDEFQKILRGLECVNFDNSILYLTKKECSTRISQKRSLLDIRSKNSPAATTKPKETADFQCQVTSLPRTIVKPVYYHISQGKASNIHKEDAKRWNSPGISPRQPRQINSPNTSSCTTLKTCRHSNQSRQTSPRFSAITRHKSQTKLPDKLDSFAHMDTNISSPSPGAFTRPKLFSLVLPLVQSMDYVSSCQVIKIDESQVIDRPEPH